MSIVGLAAALLTTLCWVPQLLRAWRTRSANDLSWAYLIVFSAGVALWLAYGISQLDLPIILANAFTLTAVLGLLELKRRGTAAAPASR